MNVKKFWIGVLVVVTVGLAARASTELSRTSLAGAAEKIQYKLKLQKGQKYYVRMIRETNTSYTIMGRERPIEEVIGFGYDFDVNQIEANGNAWVQCTCDWIKLRQKAPGREVLYDSTQLFSPVAPAAKQLSLLLGGSFQIKITPKGNVQKVKGLEAMFSKVSKNITGGRRERLMLKSLKEQFTEYAVKGLFEGHLAVYPKSAVVVGDSWRKTVVAPGGYPVIAEELWRLKGRKNGIAIIEKTSTIKPDPNAKPVVRGGTKTSYRLQGREYGLIEVQGKNGLIRDSSLSLELSGEMQVETAGEVTTGKLIPMKMRNVVSFQMTERKSRAGSRKTSGSITGLKG